MSYLLGLDIGTSGVKALLLSDQGRVAATAGEEYPLSTPSSGWAEQDPADWWQAVITVINKLLAKNDINGSEIEAISLSGQMHSSVFVDKNNQVIRPAILWSDTRTDRQCKEIYERVNGLDKLISYVSNPALEGFTAPKIMWLKQNEPENYNKVDKVLMPKDYIRFKLTDNIYTEVSDAAGTLLFDVENKKWSEEMIDHLKLDQKILPPVLDSTGVAGEITGTVAKKTGLQKGTPVVAGGADNACGAVGSGIIQPGRVMVSIGSSGVVLAQTEKPSADSKGRIHLFNHALPAGWYMMGVMLSAGMAFNWLRESVLNDEYNLAELNQMAASVMPGSEDLLFLPYLYGERTPHGDADARAVFFGLSGKHKQAHLVRSVMEGVSFGLKDSLRLIEEQGVDIEQIRVIGGGAKSKVWQQILADILGYQISLLNVEEGPAFGAAIIAGVGTGVFDGFEEVEKEIIEVKKTISPQTNNVELYDKYYKLYQKLYLSLQMRYKELTNIK
ncbi:MAG: xylulokinase [Halanaerobiales bacterium]